MNPYQSITPEEGLLKDTNSPFFGRFRLEFNQVFPFREPTFSRVFIKIHTTDIIHIRKLYCAFPTHVKSVVHLYKQKDIRASETVEIDCFRDEDWFLCFNMTGDIAYIATYNIYFALLKLALYLEDCHFFVYSSGDLDERWLDEYKIIDGTVKFSRNLMETEAYWGTIIYYLKRAVRLNSDTFTRFAIFQLYDILFNYHGAIEVGNDGKAYDAFGEEINDDIQEEIDIMSKEELEAIDRCLKKLLNAGLSNRLKDQINKVYHFDTLHWKCS